MSNINVIAHNLSAMNANRQLGIVDRKKAKNTEKLSSGYRINRAADDAAGLAISEKMRWMIRGLNQGTANTQDGISFVQIGDGAMGELHDMVNRIAELSVKAANGTLDPSDREYIDEEVQQLKAQINQINNTTVFNEIRIFDSAADFDVNGAPDDISLFNASYDDATGKFSYGGFIFDGERVTWDSVDPDMVDPNTGLFTGGTYTFTAGSGKTFTVMTEKDAEIPQMTRSLSVSASAAGVSVDGEEFGWNKLFDAQGNKMTDSDSYAGFWFMDYHGAEISFYLSDDVQSLSDVSDAINSIMDTSQKVYYVWEESYVGDAPEKAVDVTGLINGVRISTSMASKLMDDPNLVYTVKADQTGLSLLDHDGNQIAGSEKTWADMGIDSWDSGSYIMSSKKYTYSYTEGGTPMFAFDFRLCDETSVDSVIDGLNGMQIGIDSLVTHYTTKVENGTTDNTSMSGSARNTVSFSEEYNLGRNFELKDGDLGVEHIGYQDSKATLEFKAADDTSVIAFEGSTTAAENVLSSKLDKYWDKIADVKMQSAITGVPYEVRTLPDVVGAGNITTDGYFSGTVVIDDAAMLKTDGNGYYHPGENGKTYPTAYIDFANLTSAALVSGLKGTGFDSTCKTCSNHYSVLFTDSLSGSGVKTTAEGYQYREKSNGNNHVLEIDVDSLTNNGVTDGEGVAEAFVKIASADFDFHYTQYAAEGSKLYVYDDRAQNSPATAAEFWTSPYNPDVMISMSTTLTDKSGDGDRINLNYTYDITSLADKVEIQESVDNTAGLYVRNSDVTGDASAVGYRLYSDSLPNAATLTRYNLNTVYKDADGNVAAGKAQARNDVVKNTIRSIMADTTVTLHHTDFSYMKVKGDENKNVAMVPLFANNVYQVGGDDGITIVHSGMKDHETTIPRFRMSTTAMGLGSANTRTVGGALKTLEGTKVANAYISSCRSTYGALQNRFEHTINNNRNTAENLTAAESRIRDTDMSSEMVQYSNNEILAQAGQAILAQANQSKQGMLSLFS